MVILEVEMSVGKKISAESRAMAYMKGDAEIKTKTRESGFLKKLKVTALGREFVARNDCSIGLTVPPIVDIVRPDV